MREHELVHLTRDKHQQEHATIVFAATETQSQVMPHCCGSVPENEENLTGVRAVVLTSEEV